MIKKSILKVRDFLKITQRKIMLNNFFDFYRKSNFKRGLFRAFIVATLAVFSVGAYYDFSPSVWLYESVDYDAVSEKAKESLNNDSCKSGWLMYMHPVDNPKDLSYVVFEKKDERMLTPIKDCDGFTLYGEILGKEKIGNGIKLSDLTESIVRNEVDKVKSARKMEMLQDRLFNGAKDVLNFWAAVLALLVSLKVLNWIAAGFKK